MNFTLLLSTLLTHLVILVKNHGSNSIYSLVKNESPSYDLSLSASAVVATQSSENFCNEDKTDDCKPKQIRISYTDVPTEMMVTWSTFDKPKEKSSIIRWVAKDPKLLSSKNAQSQRGLVHEFVDYDEELGNKSSRQYIQRARLQNLNPGETYYYQLEVVNTRSNKKCTTDMPLSFKTMMDQEKTSWTPRLAIFGDLGLSNAQSLPRLLNDSAADLYDAVIHVGDIAYNLHSDCGKVGDQFLKMIQPMASKFPYMVCPGNHERRLNFFQYRQRFTMPMKKKDGLFYSFDMGPIHFVSLNTEVYLRPPDSELTAQYKWLEQDLQQAQKDREKRPWIITFGHRPFYCSNKNSVDCSKNSAVRTGHPKKNGYGPLEKLFKEYGVDLCIWGHMHSYERMWPTFDHKVFNGSLIINQPYTNPKAMVHVTTGAAGSSEGLAKFDESRPNWSAFRSRSYGFGRLRVENSTHLYWEQVSTEEDNKIIDSFCLVQEKHGPF